MAINSFKECPNCGGSHKGKPFAVYEDGYHCFSCGFHKSADRNFTISNSRIANDELELPELLIRNPNNFSIDVQKYLLKYHVTNDLINKYGIIEAPDTSIICPVIDPETKRIGFYTRRWILNRRYYAAGDNKIAFIAYAGDNSNTIVLVEDYISAIRVSEVFDCHCLFGTKISCGVLTWFLIKYDNIVVWLDGDKAGQSGAKKILNQLDKMKYKWMQERAFDLHTQKYIKNILTELDPKCYTKTEIKNFIEGGTHEKNS